MAEASPQIDEPEAKRRKVRKGTQSCWECKRRKVRCIFATTDDSICKNCSRRGTACISQEHCDESTPSTSSNPVETRLSRVEELLDQLIKRPTNVGVPDQPAQSLLDSNLTQTGRRPPASLTADRSASIPTPATSEVEVAAPFSRSSYNVMVRIDRLQALLTILF